MSKDNPLTEEVEIGGVKFVVTPELAKTMLAEDKKNKARIKELEDRPPEIKEVEKKPDIKPSETPLADRILTEPDKVFSEFEEKMTQKYEKDKEAEKTVASNEKLLQDFYADFFKANKELVAHRSYVEFIFQSNFQQWSQLHPKDPAKWKELLAEEAQKAILKTLKKPDGDTLKPDVVIEGGNEIIKDGQVLDFKKDKENEDEDGKKHSLTSILKERRKAKGITG